MATGLYDPAYEHDACGVGMVADLYGRPDHDIVDRGLTVLERLAHRGASGAEVETGDGAGILVQVPHRFLLGACREAGFDLPDAGSYAVGLAFLPTDPDDAAKARTVVEQTASRGGAGGARVARRADRARGSRQDGAGRHAGDRAGLRGADARGTAAGHHDAGATRLRPAQAGRARRRRVVLPLTVGPDAGVQGHAHLGAAASVLPRPARPHLRVRAGARALALLDQHLPELAPGPPLPLPVPQRRDQHPGRQPQLDAGPRGAPRDAAHPGGPRPGVPDLHPGGERLGQLRRGARAAPSRRALVAARRADDDPRGVGEPRHDGSRPAVLLPLPRLADGAVGRPGRGLLHRRDARGGGARPQRPAPGPLLGHRRRARRAGERGRRARRGARARRAQGPPAAGPHVPGGHVQGPPGRGRGDQGRAGGPAPLRGVAGRRPGAPRGRAGPHDADAATRARRLAAAPLRLHRRGVARHRRTHGTDGRRADRLHGLGQLDRRALGPLTPALRLLHPALRTGDQPAARRHPGGARHLAVRHHRPGGQPPRCPLWLVPADPAAAAGDRPRRPGQAHVRQRARRDARFQGLRHRRALRDPRGG